MNASRHSVQTIRVALLSIALLFVSAVALRAATLSDYVLRVSHAIVLLDEVAGAYGDESGGGRSEQVVAGNLMLVRQQLPAKETVKLGEQTISVDNLWLHQDLADFDKSHNSNDRKEAVARMVERLRAIQEHLQELQKTTAGACDKDSEKGRLAEILRRPEYLRTVPEGSALERLIDRFLRWLDRLVPHPKPIQPGGSPLISNLAQIVVVALCVGAIALVIWRFGPRLGEAAARRKQNAKRASCLVKGSKLTRRPRISWRKLKCWHVRAICARRFARPTSHCYVNSAIEKLSAWPNIKRIVIT